MYFHKPGKAISKATRTRVNPRSQVCLIDGVTAEPNSESGLGRRALLYCLRENKGNVSKPAVKVKVAKAPRKARTPKNTSQTPTADLLEKIHTDLATPTPALPPETVTVPAVTIAPEPVKAPETPAPAPAPETAPAAPAAAVTPEVAAPAPEAVAAETAAVATEATATLANS